MQLLLIRDAGYCAKLSQTSAPLILTMLRGGIVRPILQVVKQSTKNLCYMTCPTATKVSTPALSEYKGPHLNYKLQVLTSIPQGGYEIQYTCPSFTPTAQPLPSQAVSLSPFSHLFPYLTSVLLFPSIISGKTFPFSLNISFPISIPVTNLQRCSLILFDKPKFLYEGK